MVTSPAVQAMAGPPAPLASIVTEPASFAAARVSLRPSRRRDSVYTPGSIEITAPSGATSSASPMVG
jgi:hypothetical protein